MTKYLLATAALIAATLPGCSDNGADTDRANYQRARVKVHQAMCGQNKGDKALALSSLSEDESLKGLSDDVYDIANDIEQRGCRATKPTR